MSKQAKALKLALEALESKYIVNCGAWRYQQDKAITAIREALADSALDRMAENARKLGLDYEPPCKTGSQCTNKCQQCEQPAQQSHCNDCGGFDPECPLAQPAQQELVPVTDNTYGYAKNLAETIFKQHFASDEHYASGRIVWGVNDTVIGILTQIDNMVADMVRRPAQQQEPVAWLCVIAEADFDRDTITLEMQCSDYKVGAGQHWLSTSPPASNPWVGLTNQELIDLTAIYSGAPLYCAIEAKLREKNA